MWFKDEVVISRYFKSLCVIFILQFISINLITFLVKIITWHPLIAVKDWFCHIFHWKSILYQALLVLTSFLFSAIHLRYYGVEKQICSTRFQKICKCFSPYCLQHIFLLSILSGMSVYSYISLFNFNSEMKTLFESCFSMQTNFEYLFIFLHGCYVGIMFSLKYFICEMFLLNFNLIEETRLKKIRLEIKEKIKESILHVLKTIHWYYVIFIIFASTLSKTSLEALGIPPKESIIYELLCLRLFFAALITGIFVCIIWNLYLFIFNIFMTERYKFIIETPVKSDKNKVICQALVSDFPLLKYLAIIDLRLLAQYDAKRRQEFFTISHPGGHPHQWNSLSKICITNLQNFILKLNEFSISSSTRIKSPNAKECISKIGQNQENIEIKKVSFSDKIIAYMWEQPLIAYFFNEIPYAKMRNLFMSSQPVIWIIDALGFLISASYVEDQYGVVQQTLSQIICLLLELKMVEEKLTNVTRIRVCVKDPQRRYEHDHQRLSLKLAVNNALFRIASTFKNDINGIHLPDEYRRYFQNYVQKRLNEIKKIM